MNGGQWISTWLKDSAVLQWWSYKPPKLTEKQTMLVEKVSHWESEISDSRSHVHGIMLTKNIIYSPASTQEEDKLSMRWRVCWEELLSCQTNSGLSAFSPSSSASEWSSFFSRSKFYKMSAITWQQSHISVFAVNIELGVFKYICDQKSF